MRMPFLRVTFALGLIIAVTSCFAETEILEGKVAKITERGFVLSVGTEPLVVEDSSSTKFWKSKATAKRDGFQEGDTVMARVKTDADPPQLRELADKATWTWLDKIRKEPQRGVIEKLDTKYLTVRLNDGSLFAYRATDKSDIKLGAKTSPGLSDLSAGMTIWVKGRLLPTLDTWAAEISDAAIAATKSASTSSSGKSSKDKAPKPTPIPTSGKLEATILGDLPNLRIFDIMYGVRTLHITYNLETKFYLDGKATNHDAMRKGMPCIVHYKRDKSGRIIAAKVEMFTSS